MSRPHPGFEGGRAWLFCLLLGACWGCHRAPVHRSQPTASASVAPLARRLSLKIDEPRYDFGVMVQGEARSHAFSVTNTGSSPLELDGRTAALGCTGELEPRTLTAGTTGRLNVTCRPEYFGPLRVTVPLRSSRAEPLAEVELSASVTPLLSFDTPLVDLRMPFGEARTTDVRVQGALAERVQLTLVTAGDAGITITPLPAENGVPVGVRLHARGTQVGVHVGSIVLRTNLTRPAELSLPFSFSVIGTLNVSPTTPYFDLQTLGGRVRQIAVQSSQRGFRVRSVQVPEGPFSASFTENGTPGSFTVTVALQPARITSDAHGHLGRLLIVSNDRAEPRKELPLFALGTPNERPSE